MNRWVSSPPKVGARACHPKDSTPRESPSLEGSDQPSVGAGKPSNVQRVRAQPKLRGNAVAWLANHSTNPPILSHKPLSGKKKKNIYIYKHEGGLFACPPLGFLCIVLPCKLLPKLPTLVRSSAKAKLLQAWHDSRSWGFKKRATWVSGHCWECHRLPPQPRACRAAPAPRYLHRNQTYQGCAHSLGLKLRLFSAWGASGCGRGPRSLPGASCWCSRQLTLQLVLFWGKKCKNLSYSPGLGNVWQAGRRSLRPACSAREPSRKKRILVTQDFQPGHPMGPITWLRLRVLLPQAPPNLRGAGDPAQSPLLCQQRRAQPQPWQHRS